MPVTKGLQESIHDFGEVDEEIELQPLLDDLGRPPAPGPGPRRRDRGPAPGHRGWPERGAGPHLQDHRARADKPLEPALGERVFRIFDLLL